MKTLKKLYFCDVSQGDLYSLSLNKSRELLKMYPDWRELDADDERLLLVLKFFQENGTLLCSYSDQNLLATYV